MLFQFNGISGMQFGGSKEPTSVADSLPDIQTNYLREEKLPIESQRQLIQSFNQFGIVLRDSLL